MHTHLVDTKVSIGVEVVIFGRHVLSVGLLAAFCLATGDLGEGGWDHGSNLGLPQSLLSLQVPTSPWNKPLNHTMATLQLPSATMPPQNPQAPYSYCRIPRPQGTPRYLSHAYHLSSLSAPVSSSAHSWEGRGRQNWSRHRGGQRGAGDRVKEAATLLGKARWGPQTSRECVLSVRGQGVSWFEARGLMVRPLDRA